MPFLRFKGFEESTLREMAPRLIPEFAKHAGVSEEKVKIELIPIVRITNSPLSLEIYMFQRDQNKHDEIAAAMNQIVEQYGCSGVHIFFVIIEPELYYKNGMPLLTKKSRF